MNAVRLLLGSSLVSVLLVGACGQKDLCTDRSCLASSAGGGSSSSGSSSSVGATASSGGASSSAGQGSSSAGGGGSASSSASVAASSSAGGASSSGSSYSTSFPKAENPLSEGGIWILGGTTGVDWNDPESIPGEAFGSAIATGYNDDVGVLKTTFTANQYAEAHVHVAPGYSPAAKHEVELLLHFQITPNDARGYEVLWGITGYLAIVRWNGPLSNYTPLLDTGDPGIGPPKDGDVFRAEIAGGVITAYKNGSPVGTASDSTYTDGQPGVGFWPTPGATPEDYGFTDFTAGSM